MIARLLVTFAVILNAPASVGSVSERCPFCSAVNMTLAEQIKLNDLVVIATLVEPPVVDPDEPTLPPDRTPTGDVPMSEKMIGTFEVRRIFKGENFISQGTRFTATIKDIEQVAVGQEFLCLGIGPPFIAWDEPIASHARVETYLEEIQELPEKGPERLIYFQDYLEDELLVLAMDAYDEFAICDYADLIGMREQMKRHKLWEFILKPEVSETHRRLYFTMLGVCGRPEEDVPKLEALLRSDDPVDMAGLDSLTACYLCLKGGDGLAFIEQRFFVNEDTRFETMHQIAAALRFHGTEVDIVPREQLVTTVRKLLSRPRLADLIIPDLARWEDWTAMEELVTMFKQAGDTKSNWVRVPIFQYLIECPLPEAKAHLEELKSIDPAAFQRAMTLSSFDFEDEDDDDDDEEDEAAGEEDEDEADR